MSEQPKRRTSARKKKSVEHVIPVVLEDNAESESFVVSSSSDKTFEDDNSETKSEDTICDSVQQMSLRTNEFNVKDESDKLENMLPSVNVTEKIIIIYDCLVESDTSGFEMNGDSYSVSDVVKRCLRMYVTNKSRIDKKHEFGLIAVRKDRVDWVKGFTTNISQIKTELENLPSLEADDISDAYLDLDEIFYLIKAKTKIPTSVDVRTIAPPFNVRVVFVYTRSNCMPVFQNKDILRDVLDCPYFNFDVLMVHEDPDQENNSQVVFEKLSEIDGKGTSYCFSVGKNYSDLHFGMAKLLAHPLQRPRQQVSSYCINC